MQNTIIQICEDLKRINIRQEKMIQDLTKLNPSVYKNVLDENLENLKRRFLDEEKIDLSSYISVNNNAGTYKEKLNDYKLECLYILLKRKLVQPSVAFKLIEAFPLCTYELFFEALSRFYDIKDDGPIHIIEKGLEHDFDLNDILFNIGKNSQITIDNMAIYNEYKSYFRSKRIQGYSENIKEFINAVRCGLNYDCEPLVYHAKTIDDITRPVPVIKTNASSAIEITNAFLGKNAAIYYQDGDEFLCKCLKDGTSLRTPYEGLARSWCGKKSYTITPVTKPIQRTR